MWVGNSHFFGLRKRLLSRRQEKTDLTWVKWSLLFLGKRGYRIHSIGYIIHVYKDKLIEHLSEYVVNKGLEDSGGFCKPMDIAKYS